MTNKNPWLGLSSYEEPQGTSDDYLFCGRDEETLEVVRLIDNNLFITLYGSSGIGKTSLLRAGVIPILRRKGYIPLYVRLSQEPSEISYAEAIIKRLQNIGLEEQRSVSMEHDDGNDRLYLWNYFATTRFLNQGREVYPVIILDQFEEIFREGNKAKAELLLQQIYLLLNDELDMPNEAGYSTDTNYRFVASIREDFLFVLEDSIDENSLDLYKNNRYRLRPMKPELAQQVVLVPGKDSIEETEKQTIVKRIISLSKRQQSDDIDTLLLSLVCSGTFDKKAGAKISAADLAVWKSNPMEVYYHDAVKGLTAPQIRYIQQHLIREDGSRRRVDAEELKTAFGEATYRQLTQGTNRLLSIGDKGHVELLHDQLGMAVFEDRKAFEEREQKIKQRKKHIRNLGILFLLIILGVFITQNVKYRHMRWKMWENQSRLIAEKANSLVNEGDSYTARRLLLEVIPLNLTHQDKPLTGEAEAALRLACSHNTATLKTPFDMITSTAFSPDGRRVVGTSSNGYITIWDAESGRILDTASMCIYYYGVSSAAFSPDGKNIVFTTEDHDRVSSWDISSRVTVKHWDSPDFGGDVFYSTDGKRLFFTFFEGDTVEIHDIESKTLIYSTTGIAAAISPDGKSIASVTVDSLIFIDTEKHQVIHKYKIRSLSESIPDYVNITFNQDGSRLALAYKNNRGKTLEVLDVNTGKSIFYDNTNGYTNASFSPDGQRIAATCDRTVKLFDLSDFRPTAILLNQKFNFGDAFYPVNSTAYSRNGKLIATAHYDGIIKIWDAESGLVIDTLKGHVGDVRSVTFSPDNKALVSASYDKTVRIWDVESGQIIKTLEGRHYFASANFNPTGDRIVCASDDIILIWDVISDQIIDTLKGHYGDVTSAFYSPDGKQIISSSDDESIIIWDAVNGQGIDTLEGHSHLSIVYATFSPDGKTIASASHGGPLVLWDAQSKEFIREFEDAFNAESISFSPDGKYIVTANSLGTVRVWDVESGKEIAMEANGSYGGIIIEYYIPVRSAVFSPDGRHIVYAISNETIRFWSFPPLQELINQTRERFKDRPLTAEERKMYYLE